MKHELLKLAWIVAITLACSLAALADVIGPPPKEVAFPVALLAELDEGIAEQLKPLMPLYSANDFTGYKEAYAKIAATTETLPAVEIFWAKLLVASNRYADATRVLEEYVRGQQEDPEVYITLGGIAVRTGRFTDAWLHFLFAQRLIDRERLKKARQQLLMPNFIDARCIVAENRRQWVEAEQMYQKLQALKPEDDSVRWRAGRCQVLAGKVQVGHAMMSQACDANSNLPRATLAVAQILCDNTDWAKNKEQAGQVESWFVRAIDESPTDGQVHAAYFKWLLLDNRPDAVREKFDSLAAELKSVREIIILRSLAARYQTDLATAEALLMPIHQQNPDDMEVADQLALVLVESAEEEKRAMALQLAERNFKAAADFEAIAATAAWIQLQTGGDAMAEKILSQLANRGPMSAQTTYYVAELLRRNGRVVESRKLLQAAADSIGLFPQRSQAKQMLAKKE